MSFFDSIIGRISVNHSITYQTPLPQTIEDKDSLYARPKTVPNYTIKVDETNSNNPYSLEVKEVDLLDINQLNQKNVPEKLKEKWNKKIISPEKLVSDLLKENNLVFIGEVPHANHDAVNFTANHLESLIKNQNLDTVYIELLDDNKQYLVDNYLNAKDLGSSEKALALIYKELDNNNASGWAHKVDIIKKTKELKDLGENIKVVTFNTTEGELYKLDDIKKVFYGPWASDYGYGNGADLTKIQGTTRVIPSNNHWERVIANNIKNNGSKKGLIVAGGGHGVFPGYGNLAGAPVVLFSDPQYSRADYLRKEIGISSDFEVANYLDK